MAGFHYTPLIRRNLANVEGGFLTIGYRGMR
jgi:hypothetical protein